jgi:hypothetical protein
VNAPASSGVVSRPALWFGFIGGALAWTMHLMTAYAIAEFGCVGSLGHRSYLGISYVAWLEIFVTVVTASLAAAATFVAYRCHRRLTPPSPDSADSSSHAAERNTAYMGLLAGSLFFFVILFESIPIFFYLRHC